MGALQTRASISDDAPIEFIVPGIGDEYIDLTHTLMYLKVKIVNQDGSALIAASDRVGPVNSFLNSLFSKVDVYLYQKLVTEVDYSKKTTHL